MSNGKIKFKIKTDKFSDLIDKLDDLTKIEDSIKLKIDSGDTLMYSMVGEAVLLAFKNYSIKTSDYFDFDEFEGTLDIIIVNAKKFVKNLSFLKSSEKITLDITYKSSSEDDSVMNARSLQISGGKLKVNLLAGDQFEMRDINKKALEQRLDLKNKKWSFSISKTDFADIKKLSNINSEKIINIGVIGGKITLSETAAWELEIGKLSDDRNANLMFNKKFLPCIDENQESIEFNMFETFMLIKDKESNLMLSFEQSFDD